MNLESIRQFCLSLPRVTEIVQWEDYLLMKVGGKMFAILALEPGDAVCSLKTTPERYVELVEMQGVKPATHNMWKYNWIAVETYDSLSPNEWRDLLRGSYDLVYAGLARKVRAELEGVVAEKPAKKANSGKTTKARNIPAQASRAKAAVKKPRRRSVQ